MDVSIFERVVNALAAVITICGVLVGGVGWVLTRKAKSNMGSAGSYNPIASSADRVVLTYDRSSEATEGTFEHELTRYKNMVPIPYRDWLPWRPSAALAAARGNHPSGYFFGTLILAVFLSPFLLFPLIYGEPKRPLFDDIEMLTLGMLTFATGISAAVWQVVIARKAQKAIPAIIAYMDYLRRREISAGLEFTQSRKMHAAENAPTEPTRTGEHTHTTGKLNVRDA